LRFIRAGRGIGQVLIADVDAPRGRFQDKCLNENWFLSLDHARRMIEDWRVDYNHARPHSALGYMTPDEFASREVEKFSTGMPVEAGLTGYSNS
jgi:putative transposase